MSLDVRIKKSFGDYTLDVAFAAGDETLGFLGASGCGKSLTLRCIAGIETPDEGRIVQELPSISSDTHSAIMDKFDNWFKENGSTATTADLLK